MGSLSDADTLVRQSAAGSEALRGLVLNTEHQLRIAQAGGTERLGNLLSDRDASVRQHVANALMNVACDNPEDKLLIAQVGAIAPLVALLREDHEDTSGYALNVLKGLVNVSLWHDQDLAVVLAAQEKKERRPDIQEGLQYILCRWQKKKAVSRMSLKKLCVLLTAIDIWIWGVLLGS